MFISAGQARWKDYKTKQTKWKRCPPLLEKVPTYPCPSGTNLKISQCISFVYDPDAFQTACSALRLGVNEFLWGPFKRVVLVSYSLSLSRIALDFKIRWYGVPLPGVGSPGWGSPMWVSDPSLFRGPIAIVMFLQDTAPGCGSWVDHVSAPSIISTYLFLYIMHCRESVLLVFGSFSEIVSLYVVTISVCLWEEVNPGSFCSTILTLPQAIIIWGKFSRF